MTDIGPFTPHRDVKSWLLAQVYEPGGATCPTCTQHAQVYRRTINSGMARSLIALLRLDQDDPDGWVHVPTQIGARSREEGKLAYWALAEEERAVRPDGGRTGYWRITRHGRAFALGLVRVPKYAQVYDGRCLGLETRGDYVDIHDALGKSFDLNELLRGAA